MGRWVLGSKWVVSGLVVLWMTEGPEGFLRFLVYIKWVFWEVR